MNLMRPMLLSRCREGDACVRASYLERLGKALAGAAPGEGAHQHDQRILVLCQHGVQVPRSKDLADLAWEAVPDALQAPACQDLVGLSAAHPPPNGLPGMVPTTAAVVTCSQEPWP